MVLLVRKHEILWTKSVLFVEKLISVNMKLSLLKINIKLRGWHGSAGFFGATKRYFSSSERQIPSKCDAVIIGGGSIGCNTLYHLNKFGMKNVVLLEQNKLTSGTTWHTAGLVWSLRPNDTEIQLLGITRKLLENLEAETGISPGWDNRGGLFLASSKKRLDEYKRLHTIGKPFGIESEVLSPSEAKNVVPLLDESTLYGALYSKTDGNVDPSGLCQALTRYAKRNGSQVLEDCRVKNILTEENNYGRKQVVGIETSLGYIQTLVVVNCTGVWSSKICRMVGVNIPLVPMKHSYVIFDKMEEVRALPNLRDHDGSVYFRIQGESLLIGGYEINPIILDDEISDDFSFGLYELDWDVFGAHITQATKRLPILKDVGIKATICGPESFTPDHKPIMGEDPNVGGFYHGSGFNSAGMMLSGGCGSQLAKWIINGQPELDMFNYDVRRFSPKLTKNKQWAKERSHEAYATNYSIVYKHDEPVAGRNQFLSPVHDILAKSGCVFEERQGWERAGYFLRNKEQNRSIAIPPYDWYGQYGNQENSPNQYKEVLQQDYTFGYPEQHEMIRHECIGCRTTAAVFDMSYFGKFFLIGKDASKAAQYIFSNQMDRPAGSIIYTCILNKNGGIDADLTVTVLNNVHRTNEDPNFYGEGYYIAIGGTTSYFTYSTVKSIIEENKFDAEVVDKSENFGMFSIQGPNSRLIMEKLFPESNFSNEEFPFSTHKILEKDGTFIRVMRLTFVGEMGWELHVPRSNSQSIFADIQKAGTEYGLVNAGYRAIESLSLEKGYRHWHSDVRSDDNPLESGLSFTCKLKSNIDFRGRAALEVEKNSGNYKKRLFYFTVPGNIPLWGLETIWNERINKPVGFLRRAEYAFTLGHGIGHGYIYQHLVDQNLNQIKQITKDSYSVEVMGVKHPAKIHFKSPFDPTSKRVMGYYNGETAN